MKGFSLLELIIALAIISILSSLAYPSYQQFITKSRRHDGQMALLDLATGMERYYLKAQSYEGASIGTGQATDIASSPLSPGKWYRLIIQQVDKTSYLLEAIAQKTQATHDKNCPILTLNHLGLKGVRPDSSMHCW